jgi:hypothetical protein
MVELYGVWRSGVVVYLGSLPPSLSLSLSLSTGTKGIWTDHGTRILSSRGGVYQYTRVSEQLLCRHFIHLLFPGNPFACSGLTLAYRRPLFICDPIYVVLVGSALHIIIHPAKNSLSFRGKSWNYESCLEPGAFA